MALRSILVISTLKRGLPGNQISLFNKLSYMAPAVNITSKQMSTRVLSGLLGRSGGNFITQRLTIRRYSGNNSNMEINLEFLSSAVFFIVLCQFRDKYFDTL
jgi:hypothetical protein